MRIVLKQKDLNKLKRKKGDTSPTLEELGVVMLVERENKEVTKNYIDNLSERDRRYFSSMKRNRENE